MTTKKPEPWITDRLVLIIISAGLIVILLAIIVGIFLTPRSLPNWAENVFVSIATASALKLGDCLSTLVALASGRQVGAISDKLAASAPVEPELAPLIDDSPTGKPGDPVHVQEEGKP